MDSMDSDIELQTEINALKEMVNKPYDSWAQLRNTAGSARNAARIERYASVLENSRNVRIDGGTITACGGPSMTIRRQ